MAKLKKSILSITGNTHFYRSGDEYIVFQRKTSNCEHPLNQELDNKTDC